MSRTVKTETRVEKETVKLEALIQEKKLLEDKIKAQSNIVDELNRQLSNERLETIAETLGKKGVSVDDLFKAVKNNDLYTIQDILEKKASSNILKTDSSNDGEPVNTPPEPELEEFLPDEPVM